MEQVNQIAWNGGNGLSSLADGVFHMKGFIQILDDTVEELLGKLEELKIDLQVDPEGKIEERLYLLLDDLKCKALDIEQALFRFDEEYKEEKRDEEHKQALKKAKAEARLIQKAA